MLVDSDDEEQGIFTDRVESCNEDDTNDSSILVTPKQKKKTQVGIPCCHILSLSESAFAWGYPAKLHWHPHLSYDHYRQQSQSFILFQAMPAAAVIARDNSDDEDFIPIASESSESESITNVDLIIAYYKACMFCVCIIKYIYWNAHNISVYYIAYILDYVKYIKVCI